ncbi:MAG TPA: flagellar basal body P-ring formation chaperone FlgA [Candidatus Hydrogenedentes bacterium]|nr:flagellar basal body P-ring formation chaperone FlgA [Candidatus Hydrogenedentota bacterium]
MLLIACIMNAATADSVTRVTLKPEVHVAGPKLTVGDIADIQGPQREAVANVELGFAALPNQSRNLQASLVQSQIRQAGFSETDVIVGGAALVCAMTRSQVINKTAIEASLREFIEQELPWDVATATIDLQVPSLELVLPEGAVEFSWRPSPDYRYLGHGAFRGEIKVNGVTCKTVMCRASIEAYGPVLVAQRSIPRGQIVSPTDLVVEQRALSTLPRDALVDPEEAVGLITVKTVFPDQIITRRLLTARTVVRKNQIVTVETGGSGLVVRTRAKALADGKEGSLVLCENLDSKEQFMGEVRKDGTIRVQ